MNYELRIMNIRKKIHNSSLIPDNLHRGFTLLELLIVFSIIAFLSTLGIISFISYNRYQQLNTVVAQFVTTLNIAKSRTASQVVKHEFSACGSETIQGYKVSVLAGGANGINSYKLVLMCTNNMQYDIGDTTTLPTNIYFSNSPPPSSDILFHVLSGIVDGAGAVQIQDTWGNKKVVDISSLGNISVN